MDRIHDWFADYYLHGVSYETVPEDIQRIMFQLEYRERFGLSVEQFEREPWEALAVAQWKWAYQQQRQQQAAADSSSNG